jgi:hypothetical protein
MSYAKQAPTVDRLMRETLVALDTHVEHAGKSLERKWHITKQNLKSAIMREYQISFPHSDWNLATAKRMGVMIRIDRVTRGILETFLSVLIDDFKTRKNLIYREGMFRYAWIMDQVTPEGTDIKIPYSNKLHEATVYTGEEATTQWTERMGAWLGAYHSALNNNLALVAANNASLQDSVDKVDTTKAGTPSYDLFDALNRVIEAEMWTEAMGAEDDFYNANADELGLVEIWKTRYGLDVCDDCEENEGLTAEEAYGDIPLHPNCRCFWRVVPASFRQLLLQGNPESRSIAYDMDARGLVPDSIVMRDADGSLVGKLIVSFNQWMKDQPVGVLRGE